jgi:carboxymethylenebutenolidase
MKPPPPAPDFDAPPAGSTIRLAASDGHTLDAYLAVPTGSPRAGLVVAQEMYGLTRYVTAVCDHYAACGYLTIAPALYDREARRIVFDYTPADRDRAHAKFSAWRWDDALLDIDAARRHTGRAGKVGILGFCWGGSLAWLAACRQPFDCAVAYYGSAMPDHAGETSRCPVLANCGDQDASMPIERIRAFKARQPGVEMNVYAGARHAFDNPLRGGGRYHAGSSAAARAATRAFLARHIG